MEVCAFEGLLSIANAILESMFINLEEEGCVNGTRISGEQIKYFEHTPQRDPMEGLLFLGNKLEC